MIMAKETYLRSKAAAEYLGISYRTLQNYIAGGLIQCVKPAGQWLFKKSALDAFLNNENR